MAATELSDIWMTKSNDDLNTTILPTSDLVIKKFEIDWSWDLILSLIIGVIGMFSNAFAIIVFLSDKGLRSKIMNKFLINQSVIDFFGSFFILVNLPTEDTTKVLGNGVGDWLYCQVWLNFRLTWSLACVSTYNLMCITVERYMEIIHPLYHKVNMTNRIAYVMMAGTWIYGFAYMMTYGIPFTGIRNGVCKRFAFYPSPTSKLIAGYVNFFNNLGIPVLIMVFSYTRMAFSLRASMSGGTFENKAEEMRVKRMQRAQANIYKTMFMVAACFMICWVPSQTNFFMFNLGCCGASVTSAVFMIAMTMAYANAIVNPFIYSLRYNDFQVAAKKLFFKSNKKKNNQMADNSSSTSTSTSVASKS